MTIMGALSKWTAIHVITFEYLANAVAYVNGGVDYNLANSRALVINAGARVRRSDRENPALAFYLKSVEIVPKNSRVYLGERDWRSLQQSCAEFEPKIRSFLPPNFVGLIPAVAVVEIPGYGPVVLQKQYPLFRPIGLTSGQTHDNAGILALGDLSSMIYTSVAISHSYERPLIHTQALPEVDHRVRSKRSWKTERLEKWDLEGQMTRLIQSQPERFQLKSGLDPVALWHLYSGVSAPSRVSAISSTSTWGPKAVIDV